MYNYLVVSYNPTDEFDKYYLGFDTIEEAREFLEADGLADHTRELYDCTNGLPDGFINNWCSDEYDSDEEYEYNGYAWNDDLGVYSSISEKF